MFFVVCRSEKGGRSFFRRSAKSAALDQAHSSAASTKPAFTGLFST